MKKKLKFFGMFIFCSLIFTVSLPAYAYKFTIVYTGNAYSTLYPCGRCPASVGGGVTRRAAIIKGILSNSKDVIIIDSGNFTAGGEFDRESINPQMDRARSLYYYKAMEEMGYEAAGLGDAEFNIDIDTIAERVKNAKFKFISSNIEMNGVLPYYIKDFSGFKAAVVGLSPQDIYKRTGIKINSYEDSLNKTLEEINNKADFIILLSPLGEEVSMVLAQEFPRINVILASGDIKGTASYEQIGNTLVFRPSLRAKDLRVIEINTKDDKTFGWELKTAALSLDVSEDSQVKAVIPACFKDSDCPAKDGFNCGCKDAGRQNSACVYSEANKFSALVISDNSCHFCSLSAPQKFLKNNFPGMSFEIVDYKDARAKEIIAKYSVDVLPCVVLSAQVKQEKSFADISHFFEEKDDKLFLRRELSGVCIYLNREEKPSEIDFFLDMYADTAKDILAPLVDFCRKNKIGFNAHLVPPSMITGYPLEELKTALSVKKIYPGKYIDYLLLRVKSIKSQTFIDSLETLKMNYKRIKKVTDSKETIEKLFTEDKKLTDELGVATGNVMFVNNNRIFKVFEINEEELKELFEVTNHK